MVERHLKELILKNFDPKKADSVFIRDGEVQYVRCGNQILEMAHDVKIVELPSQNYCSTNLYWIIIVEAVQSGTNAAQWLAEMASYSPWRKLFYKLAEEYPDCLLLNFTIKVRIAQLEACHSLISPIYTQAMVWAAF